VNRLKGSIKTILKVDSLILLEIMCQNTMFTSLVLESNDSDEYKIDENIHIIFKETEVMIATSNSKVSARNSFISPILEVETGVLLCNVTFGFGDNAINAIITKKAFVELGCKIGKNFKWFVKSNEVTIQKI